MPDIANFDDLRTENFNFYVDNAAFWLLREERAGRVYTEAQKAWLRAMRDYIADNVAIAPQDLMEARAFAMFAGQGGLSLARALFGARLDQLLEELPQVLVA